MWKKRVRKMTERSVIENAKRTRNENKISESVKRKKSRDVVRFIWPDRMEDDQIIGDGICGIVLRSDVMRVVLVCGSWIRLAP